MADKDDLRENAELRAVNAVVSNGLRDEIAELRAQLAEAERQRDEARKDAERYRWIRQEAAKSIEDEDLSDELWAVWEFLLQGNNDPDEMDAAIDAAKEKTK